MTKLQEILDLWIENGAMYMKVEVKGFDIQEYGNIALYSQERGGPFSGPRGVYSLNDILYGDSNFREVMFPPKGYSRGIEIAEYHNEEMIRDGEYTTRGLHYKMQSTLRDNPIDELHELLFNDTIDD